MPLIKFGRVEGWPVDAREVEHHYEGVYAWEQTTGPARLCIAPSGNHVALLAELAAVWASRSPTWLLYVLTVQRGGTLSVAGASRLSRAARVSRSASGVPRAGWPARALDDR